MNGFVVLNKEEGMSSSFAAGRLRKIYNETSSYISQSLATQSRRFV